MNHPSPDHSIVVFSGVDALTFLQSQLTNDVAALAVGAWQWQGYCSAKGRLQATFALVRTTNDAFVAVVHSSVAATLVKRLTMFRLRAKLAIELSTALAATLHTSEPNAAAAPATIKLGHGRWVTIAPNEAAAESVTADDAFMRHWNLTGIEARQPEITNATNELFVPQMINWDHVQPGGGVSFSKGCYPGQEVVARAHYRGAVKRLLERQVLPTGAATDAGAETVLADGRTADICNSAIDSTGSWVALVVAAPATEAASQAAG